MTDTTNLALPCIEASQAQKHVTHNDALRILDALVQLAVLTRTLSAPPASPSDGQRWIVKAAGSGAWAGRDNAVAAWQDGAWQFSVPQTGWIAFVVDEGTLLVWNGTAWGDFFSSVTSIQNLALLGVGTTADATNPLSAKLNNALFTGKTVAEGGDGNLRYTLNKETAANTLSFLLQDGYSGRAEIGLTGDDDFHFKVSPDGTTWYEGIKIAAATGKVSFPVSGGPREVLTANRTYYVRTDGSDSNNGLANTGAGAFLTLLKAWNTVVTLDLGGFTATIQVADGTYAAGIISAKVPFGGAVIIQGNTSTPDNCVINTGSANCFEFSGLGTYVTLKGFKTQNTVSGGAHIVAHLGTRVDFGYFDFGACAGYQISALSGAIYAVAPYTISASVAAHALIGSFGYVDLAATVTLSGAPNWSWAFVVMNGHAQLDCWGFSTSGSSTGLKYSVGPFGLINLGGSTLPGSGGSVDALGKVA
jgi:Protein of unknown function (DUF2793)